MKMPSVKGLSKAQVTKLRSALAALYPQEEEASRPAKIGKRELRDQEVRAMGYRDGLRRGELEGEAQVARLKNQIESRQHKVEALKALTQYCSVTGQTIEAFVKAMMSEGGQL